MNTQIGRFLRAALFCFALSECSWTSLAYEALRYPTTSKAGVSNVVIRDDLAYLAHAAQGITVLDLHAKQPLESISPPAGVDQIHDLSVADGFLFALDATPPGHLLVYSLKTPRHPELIEAPAPVPVGPFSGVSAAQGLVVVSGGTSKLTVREYSAHGHLGEEVAMADFGRGQPDVLLSPEGREAFVSTHTYGPHFGLTLARIEKNPLRMKQSAFFALPDAGFTSGGFKPANFPITTALADGVAYVAHDQMLTIVDLKGQEAPRIRRTMPLPLHAVHVAAFEGRLVIVGQGSCANVVTVDVRSNHAPKILTTYALAHGAAPTGVALHPAYTVVALQNEGFQIIENNDAK